MRLERTGIGGGAESGLQRRPLSLIVRRTD